MIQVNISNTNETFELATVENNLTPMEETDTMNNTMKIDDINNSTSEIVVNDEFQLPNFSVPPPKLNFPPPATAKSAFFRPFNSRPNGVLSMPQTTTMPSTAALSNAIAAANLDDFDGKRLRKSVMRKTVDYNSSIIRALENRIWQRDFRDRRSIQPDVLYYPDLMPPPNYIDNPMNCITTRFVKTATNKIRCPIFCMAWTPEGRRLVTGGSSGEFTLWNGLTFNFETILQAHDTPVRSMVWSHNDNWMVTGDHAGYVKYWQSNMNNVKMFQAHKEALRGISFSPSDSKFVTCSDDGTLRIWDFTRCFEERILRGHGADVKCVHWHPQKSLIVSGSKDNQQPVKLWDPKSGNAIATIHAHKATVMDLKWNDNGNWLVTASRDHLLKLFDIRRLNQEVQTFRGHKKEASIVIWHPIHEGMFVSGGSDGSVMFWHVETDKEIGVIEQAHDSIVWTMAWHPLGHILCTGSNDHTSKFWTRNRPGDQMRDKYNLNILPIGVVGCEDVDMDEPSIIPGMDLNLSNSTNTRMGKDDDNGSITSSADNNEFFDDNEDERTSRSKKLPYCKPIPRHFLLQWNDTGTGDEPVENNSRNEDNIAGSVPTHELRPTALIVYGIKIKVFPNSRLHDAIRDGSDALNRLIQSGEIEELTSVLPYEDNIVNNNGSEYYDPTIDTPLDDDTEFEQRNPNDIWLPNRSRPLHPFASQFPPFLGPPPPMNDKNDEDFRFNNGPSNILPNDFQQHPQSVAPPSLLSLNLPPPNGIRFPFPRPVSLPPTGRTGFQMPRPNFPLTYPTRHGHPPFSNEPSW